MINFNGNNGGVKVMSRHTIKYEYDDDEIKLANPKVWCGVDIKERDWWLFRDAQQLALKVGGTVQPCKECVKAIISELEKEL